MRLAEKDAGSGAAVLPMSIGSNACRTLAVAGFAHAIHDGFTSTIYVLLPVWQAPVGVSYRALAALRALYVGSLAALQLPAGRLARRIGVTLVLVLVLGTLLSAEGYAMSGVSGGIVGLCVALIVTGAGGSPKHPLASAAVSRACGPGARGPLGTYNFAGDVGKALLPPIVGLLLTMLGWRLSLRVVAGLGTMAAPAIAQLMPATGEAPVKPGRRSTRIEAVVAAGLTCCSAWACWMGDRGGPTWALIVRREAGPTLISASRLVQADKASAIVDDLDLGTLIGKFVVRVAPAQA